MGVTPIFTMKISQKNKTAIQDLTPRPIGMWNAKITDMVQIHGTWAVIPDTSQTNYDPLLTTAAGYLTQSGGVSSGNEIHFGNMSLNAGIYKIKMVLVTASNGGILELRHGNTLIGTYDLYSGPAIYNTVATFIYNIPTPTTGKLRIVVNDKHALSTDYYIRMSKITLETVS